MPDASGLVSAQAEANVTPYKNIALGNPAETFLNAWALSTGLKLKQQEFEGKMQALQMKNAQMEADSQLKDKEFGMRMAMMQQGVGMREAANSLRGQQLDLNQSIFDQKVNDRSAMHNSVTGIASGLANMKTNPLDPGFMPEVYNIVSDPNNSYAPPSFVSAQIKAKSQQQQYAVTNARNSIKADTQAWQHGVSNQLWGNQMNTDTNPIFHPEQFPDVPGKLTPEQEAQLNWRQRFGIEARPQAAPTGLKSIQPMINGKPSGLPRQVSAQWLTEQAKNYQDIQDRLSSLPAIDKGAYSSLPLPSTKQQLQSGTVYITDQGDLRWTGTGFVPP